MSATIYKQYITTIMFDPANIPLRNKLNIVYCILFNKTVNIEIKHIMEE